MASELRVNNIKNRSGLGTVTFADEGLVISGITSFSLGDTSLIVGSGTSTGTADQKLQVTGGAYVSGNFGLGTTVPQTLLHVASTSPYIRIQDTDSSTSITAQGGFEMYDSDGDRLFFLANDSSSSADVSLFNNAGGALRFGTSGTERVRIDSSGNLGIGITNPTTKLDVNGIAQFTANAASLNLVGTDHTYIQWYPDGISAGRKGYTGYPSASEDNFFIVNQIESAGIVFGTSGAEKARITNPGYLLLGLTSDSPSSAPEPARFVSSGSGGQAAAHFYTDQTSKVLVYFSRTAFGITGTITTSGSSTAYNTTSDYRLKENVVPLTGAIQRLLELPVHRFNFISEPDKTVDGFIAHEAAEVVPECVTGKKDEVDANGNPIHQGIDQSKLVPLLTAALKEAIGRIETLEAEVRELKGTSTT